MRDHTYNATPACLKSVLRNAANDNYVWAGAFWVSVDLVKKSRMLPNIVRGPQEEAPQSGVKCQVKPEAQCSKKSPFFE